jgi:hypothetical protein
MLWSHGSPGFKRQTLGRMVQKVVWQCPVPVLEKSSCRQLLDELYLVSFFTQE